MKVVHNIVYWNDNEADGKSLPDRGEKRCQF